MGLSSEDVELRRQEAFLLAKVSVKMRKELKFSKPQTWTPHTVLRANESYFVNPRLASELVSNQLAFINLPIWLTLEGISDLKKLESESSELMPPPDEFYLELAEWFFDGDYNAWWKENKPLKVSERTKIILEEYIELRQTKILKLNAELLTRFIAITSNLTYLEKQMICWEVGDYRLSLVAPTIEPVSVSDMLYEIGGRELAEAYRDHRNKLKLVLKDNDE